MNMASINSSRSTVVVSSLSSEPAPRASSTQLLPQQATNQFPVDGSNYRARSLCICMSLLSPSTITGNYDNALLKYIRQPMVLIPTQEDEGTKRREYLLARTAGKYYNNLFTTALRFRLLRHNGFQITSDVFLKFMDENRKFKESLADDTLGLLSLYEASYMGANGEEILEEATKFTKAYLQLSTCQLSPPRHHHQQVIEALKLPRHMRMARLETRQYIEKYGGQIDCDAALLELATLDYNKVQTQHQIELAEITRWWKQLVLVEKLTFARDRPLECFLWTVGLLPEPKYSTCRIELAKTIAILLVIDDIFDTCGKMDELVIFTDAIIRRWDLEAIETLPEYMKICYLALYNTTNEICYKVLKENGWTVLPYLKSTWIDMIEGFMVQAKWFNGEGVTRQNSELLLNKPYPNLFSSTGRILRLWDDLGTSKEEQERGDMASSIRLFVREKNIEREEEGIHRVLEEIYGLWKDLNSEMMCENRVMPMAIIEVALNMARELHRLCTIMKRIIMWRLSSSLQLLHSYL
ncbi:hypothetical protein ABFX02_04G080300 [Erythranthe guttata]